MCITSFVGKVLNKRMYHQGEGQKGTTGCITNSHQNYVLGNQDASCPSFADMKNTGIKLAL